MSDCLLFHRKNQHPANFFFFTTAQMAEWHKSVRLAGAVHLGLILSRVKSMTLKLIFTASLLDAQH